MLKQVTIFLISVVILIFGGVWEIKYIESSSRYILSDIEYSKNALKNNNFNLAKEHIKKLEDTWNNTKKIWSMFAVQDKIQDVDTAIAVYKIYTEYENLEESLVNCDLIKNNIEGIVEEHKINYENIF